MDIINTFLHLDVYLSGIVNAYGTLSYFLLFATIFAETGLVLVPFLPGDSLLFAAGAVCAISSLDIIFLITILFIAAFLGNMTNYFIGRFFGEKLVCHIKPEYLEKTNNFYNKYGGFTIFATRFIPILRTIAPFVAGMGKMDYNKFIAYNALGGLCWVLIFTLSGYYLGNIPQVKENFSIIVVTIIIISFIPIGIELIKNRKKHD